MEPLFIGQIKLFAGNFAPRNWSFCEGQLLYINNHQALYSILGTTYGGDGRTTFALPDLRGRTPIHVGNGPALPSHQLGEKGGTAEETINIMQMPSHSHPTKIAVNSTAANETDPTGFLASSNSFTTERSGHTQLGGVITGNTGGNQPFDNRPPFLALNFIIAISGTFPSRG